MNCPKCNHESVRALVNVVMYVDSENAYSITKKAIVKSSTELWALDHEKTSFVCTKCMYAWGGRLLSEVDTTKSSVPNDIKESIRRSSFYKKISAVENDKIRKWLFKNNLLNDANIDQLVDSTEIGDYPEEFISYLENDPVVGNKDGYKDDYITGE